MSKEIKKTKKMKFKIIALLFLGILSGNAQTSKKAATATKASSDGIFAAIETNKGKIVIQLEYQKVPVTVANFITLAEGNNIYITDAKLKGKPFYDGLKFHRVIKDFMIQGGDPAGNGSGGTGYSFKDEFVPELKHNAGGILSMANSGPGTNSSQFFITHKETPWLDNKHTVFGHVVSGMDVVNTIVQDDVILKMTIERKGTEAKKFDAQKVLADYFLNKAAEDKKIMDKQIEERANRDKTEAEAKKQYDIKYAPVKAEKVSYFSTERIKATKSTTGLEYVLIKKGNGVKPTPGSTVYIHYAGYLEDGSLFDSSYEEVAKANGKYDANRAAQKGGYDPFPFEAGKKDGLIPGFLEGLNTMNFGDKLIVFIPANLGYGAQGAGNIIPPNSNIIFEIELFETMPTATPKQ